MKATKILTAAGLGIAVSLLGLAATATPAAAHPCFGNTGSTFTCLEPYNEAYRVCVGTYDDDNNNGAFDHNEENTYVCTNGEIQ